MAGNSQALRKPKFTIINGENAKTEIFRQTRNQNDLGNLIITFAENRIELKNWSRTGVGFEVPTGSFQPGQKIEGVTISSGEITVFEGSIEVKSVKKEGNSTYIGAAFSSNLLFAEGVESAQAVNDCAVKIAAAHKEATSVPAAFCQGIVALRNVLRQIKDTCTQEEKRWKKLPYDRRIEAEHIFLPAMTKRVKEVLTGFNKDLAKLVDVESLPQNSPYHKLFQEEVYPLFEGADFLRRAFEKPRGYAGDYEMMNQIYRNGYEGNDLFGRVLHAYGAGEASSESVKFRKPYFLGFYRRLIEKKVPFKTLSIACGPAVEVQELIKTASQSELELAEITLFDLDREALEHAQTKIYETAIVGNKNPHVSFVNASVKAFLANTISTNEKFDFIYSGGLFDYLDNATSAALTQKFAALLKPKGTLVIGNFTDDNPTKAFCHLLTDWALIHKNEQEIRDWAKGIKGCTVEIEYDKGGINAFLILKNNGMD